MDSQEEKQELKTVEQTEEKEETEEEDEKSEVEDEKTETTSDDSSVDSKKKPEGLMKGSELGPHDVLLGRGLGTYNHIGNVKFRKLVNKHKLRYVACCKVDKPKIARELVRFWRQMDPPGRFLARTDPHKKGEAAKPENSEWHEIGDKKAQEKASQCLRERTPDVMPYYKYMRACKKERKARAMHEDAMGGAAAAVAASNAVPSQLLLRRPEVPSAARDFGARPSDMLLQRQLAEQQLAAAQAPRILLPPSSAAFPTLVGAPLTSLLQVQMLNEQRQAAAARQIDTTAAPAGATPMMVPLELLLQREQELKDRELEAHILRTRLNATTAAARPPVLVHAGAVLQPMMAATAAPTAIRFQPLGAARLPATAPTPQLFQSQALLPTDKRVLVYPQGFGAYGTLR